ncbi:hypothetical protein O3Q52_07225 [Streptomyces sp. ActVer]|uniref:hypothetical protein n=1 Tax=Streptomyces sp. ActVer TaxID=3014558 RepID=UPI0022B572E4|nr:hypothetical protein [Streptomyces sp. ActVer]MCZ4507996.1 hypothetical protein [Streptomyces sp. ActVer]
MPGDHVTQCDGRGQGSRPSRAGARVRAVTFALVGSVLAAVGHHAVKGGQVPWRLVIAFAVAQFVVVRPFARRRPGLLAVVGCTLAAQAAMHLALTTAGGHRAGMGHTAHDAMTTGAGGHPWRHASETAMTTAHVVAALVVAWLLHRADTAVTAALATGRTLRAAAAAVMARFLPGAAVATAHRPLPVPLAGSFELPAGARTRTLEHALVRRGPPGRTPVPVVPLTRARPRPARFHSQGVPPCPCPSTGVVSY